MSKFFQLANVPTDFQLVEMLEMQDTLNKKIAPDWAERGWLFGDAIVDECMELKGHLGWKWWKDSSQYQVGLTDKNIRQVQLELVDIWHFFLSCVVEEAVNEGKSFMDIAEGAANHLSACKDLMAHAVQSEEFCTDPNWYISLIIRDAMTWEEGIRGFCNLEAFYALMCITGLGGQNLVDTYIGKYALNKFRYDNGYAEGSYLKHWMIPEVSTLYQEDNWYLEKVLADQANLGHEVTVKGVYAALSHYYSKLVPATKH